MRVVSPVPRAARLARALAAGIAFALASCRASDSTAPLPPLTWTRVASGTTERLSAIWGSSATDVWVIRWDGTPMHYDGARWSSLSKPRTGLIGFVVRMWGSAPTNIWVGGLWTDRFDSTAFLRFDGTQWRSTMVPRGYTAIWSSGGSTAWAAGNSTFAVFDGSAWAAATSGTGTVYDMWGSSASDVWAVGADGIWRYSGTTWSSVTSAA